MFFPEDLGERTGSHAGVLKGVGERKPGCQAGKCAFNQPADKDHGELHVRAFTETEYGNTIIMPAGIIRLFCNRGDKSGKILHRDEIICRHPYAPREILKMGLKFFIDQDLLFLQVLVR